MENDRALLSHIDDCAERAEKSSMITNGNFLDIREQSVVTLHCKHLRDVKCFLYGGYGRSERMIPLFLPYYIDFSSCEDARKYFSDNPDDDPLCVIRAVKDNFTSLTHRDYLGALMGLGIKREMIGDIIVSDSGADIIVLKKIADYILSELRSAGRATLSCSKIDASEIASADVTAEEKVISVASARLDNVIGACFNLSRGDSSEYISGGLVFLNGIQTFKQDKKVSIGDKIVLRGKGKATIEEDRGVSKKGRNFLLLNIYR